MTAPSEREDFATAEELTRYWKPLSEAKFEQAGYLLQLASQLIRDKVPSIDARLAAGTISTVTVAHVALDMVTVAMLPGDQRGRTQFQRVKGPFTDSGSLVNPAGSLYLSPEQLARLDAGVATAPQWHFGDCP